MRILDYTTNPEKTANPEYSAEDYQALKDVLAYAKDEEKTEHEFFCDGINCNVAMARDQFITVKEQFGKTDGIQAYHGYLSFKENEVTPEQAQQIGMEFARKMWGKRFQVVVTTHLNTKHLHCHFVINSVSFADGKRLKDKEKSWYYFRHIADEICLEHKLSIVEKPALHRSPAYLTMKDEAGMPTRYNNAKKAIDEAIAMSRNLRQFQYELSVMGYHSNFSPNRKYATVTPKGSEKPIRTYRLGEEYWCGLREGEMLALTLQDIDLEQAVIYVNKTYQRFHRQDIISTPKTPSSVRKVSMPAFLCDELREYIDMLYSPAPEQRIFAITKSKLTHRFHKLSEEAGLRRITVHGLRHSHVSLLISKKYDIFEVSKRIGHKSIKTTQDIYGHLFDEVQKTIANDLDSLRRR